MSMEKTLNHISHKSRKSLIAMAFLGLCFCLPSLFSDTGSSKRETPVVEAVRKILPAVVNISAGQDGDTKAQDNSKVLGSGSFVDPSGLILTNSHVIEESDSFKVTTSDGKTFSAFVIADDPSNDLALLKIIPGENAHPWPTVKMAEPGDLLLGETVIMAGNPYGLGSSVSMGILGAIGRKVVYKGQIVFNDILQVDAPIYPGNSGGPLINLDGDMIGISTAVHKSAPGIGFAIPVMRLENVLASWLLPERFQRAKLGFVPAVRKLNGKPEIYIYSVAKKSPAWDAGIRGGEIIKSFDGKPVASLIELSRELMRLKTGNIARITDTEGHTFSIRLAPLATNDGNAAAKEILGISLQQMTPALADALGFSGLSGLVVSDSPATGSKIKRGDLITEIDGRKIKTFADVANVLKNKVPGDPITLRVVSSGSSEKTLSLYSR